MLTVNALIACDAWADRTGQERPAVVTYMQRHGRKAATEITLAGKTALADAVVRVVGGGSVPALRPRGLLQPLQ